MLSTQIEASFKKGAIMKIVSVLILSFFSFGCVQQQQDNPQKSDSLQTNAADPDTNLHPIEKGYKEFHWGESIQTVRSKAGSLNEDALGGQGVSAILYAYYFQYGRYSPDQIYPERQLYSKSYRYDNYSTKDKLTEFSFQNKKLLSVTISFGSQLSSMIGELEQKYGSVDSQFLLYGGAKIEFKAWFSNSDRIIVYQCYDASNESITYSDKSFYDAFVNSLQAEKQKDFNTNKQKID